MSGENKARFTGGSEIREHVKTHFRAFFSALHSGAKRWPGGITELAHMTGRSPVVLADKLNPNQMDKVPTLEEALVALELVQPVAALNALALLAGRVTVPVPESGKSPREVVSTFLALARRAGEATGLGADAVADGWISPEERATLAPMLDELLAATVEFQAVVKGG